MAVGSSLRAMCVEGLNQKFRRRRFQLPTAICLPPTALVAGDGRVYFRRPAVDAAGEVVDFLEALAREVGADLRAADAVVADEDRGALGVERRRPLVEEAQGQQPRALDPRQLVLLRLAHVHEQQVL